MYLLICKQARAHKVKQYTFFGFFSLLKMAHFMLIKGTFSHFTKVGGGALAPNAPPVPAPMSSRISRVKLPRECLVQFNWIKLFQFESIPQLVEQQSGNVKMRVQIPL